MKDFDKKVWKAGLVLFLTVCASLLFYYFLFNNEDLLKSSKNIINIFIPIIDGFAIAYLLNPLLGFIQAKFIAPLANKINNRSKIFKIRKKAERNISILLAIIIFLLFIYIFMILVIPQVIDSVQSIIVKFPSYMNSLNLWIDGLLEKYPDLQAISERYSSDIEGWFINNAIPVIQSWITSLSSNLLGGVFNFISAVFNLVIGLIVSVYLLGNKEVYCAQAKKIAYALLREERANNLINNMRFANKTFGGFISGKIVDSIIIGLLCFIGLTVMNTPYSVLISVIVGVTNVIPYFGPYIGAIPSAIILIMVSPVDCLKFVIFVFILQQFDGNFLGPKILGNSTGLSSFWVIFAITLFGGLFGVLGMFIGVPLFAIIYASIKSLVNGRLSKKMLPVETSFYMLSDYHSGDSTPDENTGKDIKFVKKTFDKVYVEGRKNKDQDPLSTDLDNKL